MADEIESRDAVEDVTEPIVDDVSADDPSTLEPEVGSPEPEAGLSEALIGRAQDYGLSSDDLTGLDETKLERMFSAIDRRIMQPATQPADYRLQAPGAAPTTMPEQYEALKVEYGDDLDDSVRTPFQSVVDHMNGQLKQAHAFRQHVQKELQAMNVLREFSSFDQFVRGLGDDWKNSYGSGATMEMDPQSGDFQKRLEVFHGARSLMADAQRRGQRMSVSDALTRSHHAVHWDRIAEHTSERLNGKIERRRKGFSEPAVKGKAPAMSPREEAENAWR